jgi:YVTN family beta-propeller protein
MRREKGAAVARALRAAALAGLFGAAFPGESPAAQPPRGRLVVLNKSDNTASIVDAATGQVVQTIPVGFGPHEAETLPGGRVVAVSNYGTRERPGHTLTLLDLEDLAHAHTITLPDGARPHGMKALSAERLLVTAEGLKELLVVEPARGRVLSRIPLGREISHMVVASPAGDRAYVANIGSGSVTVVDPVAGKVIAEIPTGAGAEGIDVRPGGVEIWVANREANTVSVIDSAKLAVVATLLVPGYPIRLKFTPDGARVLVSCAKTGEVAVFDAAVRREIRRIGIDREAVAGSADRLFSTRFNKSPVPVGLLVAPDGSRAWVASSNADVVSVLDLDRLEVIGRITAGREPDGLAGAFAPPAR